ncbi:MAG: dihydropteroate synthase [Candidatus Hodarchaeales archaeon]|jgi:dihydropteroate synthase
MLRIIGELAGIKVGDQIDTRIMGIINLSPTSFYYRSIKQSKMEIRTYFEQIIEEGADFIDVGAVSSAPSFLYDRDEDISSPSTEINRLSIFFKEYSEVGIDLPVSIDTQSAKIANFALSKGARIINDISGFKKDSKLAKMIADYDASAIVMACRKKPGDVFSIKEIISELRKSLEIGLDAGILGKKMVIDPGLGGWVPEKQIENDYQIINHLEKIRELNHAILLGISRKSFIGKVLNMPPEKRLWGSLAVTAIAVMNGAHVIRTHDVRSTKDVCLITDFMRKLNKNKQLMYQDR